MLANKRLSHIDLLESIAIFFVIMYHGTIYSFDVTKDNSIVNYLLYYCRTILSTCVPLFFFANGYLLLNKEFNLEKHIRKTIRLVVLFFVWAFLLVPLYMIISGEEIKIKTIILSVFNLDASLGMNVFWFIGALICIYILFPALKALFDKSKKAFILFTVTCFVFTFGVVFGNQVLLFVSTLKNHNYGTVNYNALSMFNPFRSPYCYSFVYFCVGGVINAHEKRIIAVKRVKRNIISFAGIFVSCACLLLVGVFYTKYVDYKMWDVVWNGYDTIFTFFNVLFIYTICLNYSKGNNFVKSISCNTLGIYFTHILIIRLTSPWIKIQALKNLPTNILYSFLVMCVCLLLCQLIHKIPIIKKLI